MKSFLVDSLAAIVFFTIVAGFSEIFVAGMSPDQVLASRLASIPAMLITSRPYGIWRDLIFRITDAYGRNPFQRGLIDTVAFISFQVPVYGAILAFAGADLAQALSAISSAIVFMVLLSRPFGVYLDFCRKLAHGPQPAD